MDQTQLTKFFPTDRYLDPDTEQAIQDLTKSAREFAMTLQSLLQESGQKTELHMRLFHILRDAEMALRLDGPSRVQNMVVITKQ